MAAVYHSAPLAAIDRPGTEPPRLLDRLRFALRAKHYAYRTEQAYVHWVRRFILHHGKRHPQDMGGPEIEGFLTDLAVAGKVAASTIHAALRSHVIHLPQPALPPGLFNEKPRTDDRDTLAREAA